MKHPSVRRLQLPGAAKWAPVVARGSAYVVIEGAVVICLDLKSGKTMWSSKLKGGLCRPSVGESVYVATTDGTVFSLDLRTGDEQWARTLLRPNWFRADVPQPVGDTLLATTENFVYALDALSGKTNWRFPMVGGPSTPIVPRGTGDLLYCGMNDGAVLALRVREGKAQPFIPPDKKGRAVRKQMVIRNGRLYMNLANGPVRGISLRTAKVEWRGPERVYALAGVSPNEVYVTAGDMGEVLQCIDIERRAVRWSKSFPDTLAYGLLSFGKHNAYACTWDARLHALDRETGEERWSLLFEATDNMIAPKLGDDGWMYLPNGSEILAVKDE